MNSMQKVSWKVRVAAFAAACTLSSVAIAQDLFPVGANSKMVGVESAVMADGASAVALNPAALSRGSGDGAHPYAEVGFGAISASYEHPDFDPVVVDVRTPLMSVGHTQKFRQQGLAVGLLFYPVKRGEVGVPGLPRSVAGQMRPLAIKSAEDKARAGLGFGYQLTSRVHIGLGLLHTFEQRSMTVSLVGSDRALVEFDGKRNGGRMVAGVLAELPMLDVGLSYTTGGVNRYQGQQRGVTDTGYVKPTVTGYDPAALRVGLAARLPARIQASAHANHRFWSPARTALYDGLTSQNAGADVHDTTDWSAALGWRMGLRDEAVLSYAQLPSPWGEGSGGEAPVLGVDFGMLDATDRQSVGLGWRHQENTFQVTCAVQNWRGSREVGRSGANTGFYQSQATLFVTGLDIQL